jgi:hypothetical protein
VILECLLAEVLRHELLSGHLSHNLQNAPVGKATSLDLIFHHAPAALVARLARGSGLEDKWQKRDHIFRIS